MTFCPLKENKIRLILCFHSISLPPSLPTTIQPNKKPLIFSLESEEGNETLQPRVKRTSAYVPRMVSHFSYGALESGFPPLSLPRCFGPNQCYPFINDWAATVRYPWPSLLLHLIVTVSYWNWRNSPRISSTATWTCCISSSVLARYVNDAPFPAWPVQS